MINTKTTNKLHFSLATHIYRGDHDADVTISIDDITPDMRISDLLLYLEDESDYLVVRRGAVLEPTN